MRLWSASHIANNNTAMTAALAKILYRRRIQRQYSIIVLP
jgi:hypothetical protein